ncbi:LuxR C-terminal-related transcriptional regulator [Paenibacillus sp. J2TS4]|uniref:protein kinase domain-containing protein n=1 Tax=Paenibacillus sp. J2TS4 TaxID=2807194 RepID=UPI001B0969D0|nr:LuxR C-terminal-related transcriptional regulator [Paenibacillus sp. J2TS4]GIP31652.1 hypothetical protein J2TS4_08620 [Paenibacillus sp. J2TS4]
MEAIKDGLNLPGYDVDQIIYEDPYLFVCYAYAQKRARPALLKVVKEGSSTFVENAKLLHEYEGAARVPMDGILRPMAIVPHGNAFILEYERVNGVTLRRYFEMQSVSLTAFLELGIEICRMVEALHQQQVLHLNLKPDTILVQTETMRIYVTGFGYAQYLQQDSDGHAKGLMKPSLPEGHPIYMSPEQTGRMNCELGPYSDLYSLGVTWYELLAGEPPFKAASALAWSHAHMALPPVPLAVLRPQLPAKVAAIVMKLLEKDPEARYPDARTLRAALEECLAERLNSQAPDGPGRTAGDEAGRQCSVAAMPTVEPRGVLPYPALGLTSDAPPHGMAGTFAGELSSGYPQALDLAAIVQASRTFTEGWRGRDLAAKLLAVILMQAGAGQGYLIMPRQDEPYVEAAINLEANGESGWCEFRPCPLSECGEVQRELVYAALHSGKAMLLRSGNRRDDAGKLVKEKPLEAATQTEAAKQSDAATQPTGDSEGCPASVLVLSIQLDGQVRGCLYLVNHRSRHAFVPERQGTLHILACQLLYVAETEGRALPPQREKLQSLAKVEKLTAREREVLNLLARSLSNREIAEGLQVSFETVKAHIKNIFKKLGVDRRMKAVSVAKTLGWLDEQAP